MFENFTPFDIQTQSSPDVTIHGLTHLSSNGPPLLLLHGFPQTHHIWHLTTPHLTTHFKIILLDLRGYGSSSKPRKTADYAKSAMSKDIAVVMEKLGFSSYYICAHDRGARVAHKLLVNYPSRVKKAIFLDICPTLAMFEYTNQLFATAYWHWFFLIQKEPLPEMMILNDPPRFAELFMGGRYASVEMFDKTVLGEYVKGLGDEGTVHAMCEDYRAAATLDLEEAKNDIKEGRLIKSPLRILWGKHGIIEKCFDGVGEWKKVSEKGVYVDGESVDCGHYIPEEKPDVLVRHILKFFGEKGSKI